MFHVYSVEILQNKFFLQLHYHTINENKKSIIQKHVGYIARCITSGKILTASVDLTLWSDVPSRASEQTIKTFKCSFNVYNLHIQTHNNGRIQQNYSRLITQSIRAYLH